MASLFDIGKSGLQAYRQSLSVTGQNIANINTDGYKRREADLGEVTSGQGTQGGAASKIGLGVRVSEIRRSFDSYLQNRSRTATAQFETTDAMVAKLRELENMLLPGDAGIGNFLGNFFGSLQAVAAAPADKASRIVAIEDGKALAENFRQTAQTLGDLKSATIVEANESAKLITSLAAEIAGNNKRLMASGKANASNALLDTRDRLIDEVSRLAEVTVDLSDQGAATVRLGKSGAGLALVDGGRSVIFGTQNDGRSMQFTIDGTPTTQVLNGKLKGLKDAFTLLTETAVEVDQLAFNFTQSMNAQHRAGLTMDGADGGDMFQSLGFKAIENPTNTGSISVEFVIHNIDKIDPRDVTLAYNAEQNVWIARNQDAQTIATGRNSINLPGLEVKLIGQPNNNDEVIISPARDYAGDLSFLIERPGDIAAASRNLVSADLTNDGSAVMTAEALPPTTSTDSRAIQKLLSNSDTVISAAQFLQDGVAVTIPENIGNVSLTSYDTQEQLQFSLAQTELSNLSTLSFSIIQSNGSVVDHQIDVSYGSVFPGDTGRWEDASEVAEYLNLGTMKTAGNSTLADLGMYAAGAGGQLTFALASNSFSTDSSKVGRISAGGTTIIGTNKAATSASDIQIFTREGRHIAGSQLSAADIASIITSENGFDPAAEYRSDYLNIDTPAYRDMTMTRSRQGGDHRLTLGSNGTGASAVSASGALPASPTTAYNLSLQSGTNTASISVPVSSSAGYLAAQINKEMDTLGVRAKATTRVELISASAASSISFSFESNNQSPLTISANISTTDLSDLATKINQVSTQTGVTATLSSDKARLVLENADGGDVMFSDFTYGGTLTARVVDGRTQSRTSDVVLGAVVGSNTTDAARFGGEIELLSAGSFSVTQNGATATSAQSEISNGFIRETMSTTGEKSTLSFNLNDGIEGNQAGSSGMRASVAAAQIAVSLPATGTGTAFAASVDVNTLLETSSANIAKEVARQLRATAPTTALSGAAALTTLPDDQSTVQVSYGGETYTLKVSYTDASVKTNPDITVTGGEEGRLSAYFDASKRLQVIATGGAIDGGQISVPGNAVIAGNGDAAELFGLDTSLANPTVTLSGRSVTLPVTTQTIAVDVGGVAVNVSIALSGSTYTLTSDDTSKLTATFAGTDATTTTATSDRILLQTTLADTALTLPHTSTAETLGFKTSQYEIKASGDDLEVVRSDGSSIDITRSASTRVGEVITLSNLPPEELIVVLSGSGARLMSAAYDEVPANAPALMDEVSVKVINADSGTVEFVDKATGHSIATRVLDASGQTKAAGYQIGIAGKSVVGDSFHIEENTGAVGDGRNISALVALQQPDVARPNGAGFQQMFNDIVTTVGASLRSGEATLDSVSSIRDASIEAEARYSGINLDSEAAKLIEQQQAYQASARILQTARELFQTLMDTV